MPDDPVYAGRSLGCGMLIVCNAGMHQAGRSSTPIVIDLGKGAAASIADSTAVMLLAW